MRSASTRSYKRPDGRVFEPAIHGTTFYSFRYLHSRFEVMYTPFAERSLSFRGFSL
jgi:hypothetical protein